jgi:hypothetical protein
MGRTVKAFLIAPLWVPVALLILAALAPERELVWAIAAVSGVITYAATLIFGYPAVMLMWRCKLTGPGAPLSSASSSACCHPTPS